LIVSIALSYLPFSQSGGQLLFHLISKLYEDTSLLSTTNLDFAASQKRQPRCWTG
jgi:DNA replication protein DnaC